MRSTKTYDIEARVSKTEFLEKRLEMNKSYASADFDSWLFERLQVKPGDDILDVGCGSGAQSVLFSRLNQPGGSVSALDISADSVALLKQRVAPGAAVEAIAADMATLADVISNNFSIKRFDLVHSSYALYYSASHTAVLDVMRKALKPGGRCVVFTPCEPHGLVELAARFTSIPQKVTDSLSFGPNVLKGYFDNNFRDVAVHRFHNEISVPSTDLVVEFYRQTTYYDAAVEAAIREVCDREIAEHGAFRYEKNGYLIIGRS